MLNKSQVINYLNSDIEKLKVYFIKSNSSKSKKLIQEKLILMELKKIVVESNCPYIENTYTILKSENVEDIKEALIYLKKKYTFISHKNLANYHIVVAFIYEILGKRVNASKEYKSALKYSFNKDALKLYRDFVDRARYKKSNIKRDETKKNINIDIESLSKSAKSLEAIAKKYTQSYKSFKLAQKYYKYALDIYKQLMQAKPTKYKQNYILALIKGVETYNLPKELLKEAESLLFYDRESQDTEFYLLNKIKALKGMKI